MDSAQHIYNPMSALTITWEDSMVQDALRVATFAHGFDTRKYTDDPYIIHPMAVARLVDYVLPNHPEAVAAALLHDVVEDTPVTLDQIQSMFGPRVRRFVNELTNVSTRSDGSRPIRKKIDREHSAKASDIGQTIKLADIIDNTRSIVKHDPAFAKAYMPEKWMLIKVLIRGHQFLRDIAEGLVVNYFLTEDTDTFICDQCQWIGHKKHRKTGNTCPICNHSPLYEYMLMGLDEAHLETNEEKLDEDVQD